MRYGFIYIGKDGFRRSYNPMRVDEEHWESILENSMKITELSYELGLIDVPHDYLFVDWFIDVDGYNNSIDTANTNAVYSGENWFSGLGIKISHKNPTKITPYEDNGLINRFGDTLYSLSFDDSSDPDNVIFTIQVRHPDGSIDTYDIYYPKTNFPEFDYGIGIYYMESFLDDGIVFRFDYRQTDGDYRYSYFVYRFSDGSVWKVLDTGVSGEYSIPHPFSYQISQTRYYLLTREVDSSTLQILYYTSDGTYGRTTVDIYGHVLWKVIQYFPYKRAIFVQYAGRVYHGTAVTFDYGISPTYYKGQQSWDPTYYNTYFSWIGDSIWIFGWDPDDYFINGLEILVNQKPPTYQDISMQEQNIGPTLSPTSTIGYTRNFIIGYDYVYKKGWGYLTKYGFVQNNLVSADHRRLDYNGNFYIRSGGYWRVEGINIETVPAIVQTKTLSFPSEIEMLYVTMNYDIFNEGYGPDPTIKVDILDSSDNILVSDAPVNDYIDMSSYNVSNIKLRIKMIAVDTGTHFIFHRLYSYGVAALLK